MSSNYSRAEVESIVKQIEVEAKEAGLIPLDSNLVYSAGNASNGISGTVMCYATVRGETGNPRREFIRDADDFLPVFTYKMTKNDQARVLNATLRVFHTFRKQREAAAAAKRRELSEHTARRSGT